MALSMDARQTLLQWHDVAGRPVTIAGYTRYWFPEGTWGGDSCGCPDDRCIGYHHDGADDCGCLPVCIDIYLQAQPVRA